MAACNALGSTQRCGLSSQDFANPRCRPTPRPESVPLAAPMATATKAEHSMGDGWSWQYQYQKGSEGRVKKGLDFSRMLGSILRAVASRVSGRGVTQPVCTLEAPSGSILRTN